MTENNGPDDNTGELTMIEVKSNGRQPRLAVRLLGLLLVLFSVFAATYLIVGYFALESGRELRIEQETTARADEIAHQIELARANQAEGSDNLALTRLEWVLAQDPSNEEALALRQQLLDAEAQPTEPPPTAAVEQTPDATVVVDDSEAGTQLAAIRRLAAAEDWEAALSQLLAFQHTYPDYERGETDQLLYDTYLNLGLSYINTEKIEIGLNYFAQAERLGNLPQEARDYRSWADLYFQAVAYSGVNWDVAAGYWRDLCSAAPFFQDSCDRYDQALVGYGDQFAFNLDWCPAVDAYRVAWNRRPSELLDSKIAQAIDGCASATAVPITGTNPISDTVPITDTESPVEPGG
jgi:hypothetical protein